MKLPMPENAPDFYVVGAPKAGTTAVFNWLRAHPDIFLPSVKEPGYFAFAEGAAKPANGPFDPDYVSRITVDADACARLCADARGGITGDVSPVYLIDEKAAERIAAARPDARVIVLLRDPVKRAYSQFLHHVRDGLEPCKTFEAALDAEPARLRDGWSWGHGYAKYGEYATQIARYLDAFPKEQIMFIEYEMLQSRPELCWRKICRHLSLDACPLKNNARVNSTRTLTSVGGRPRLVRAIRHPGRIQAFLKPFIPGRLRAWLRRIIVDGARGVPTLSEPARTRLARRYRPERSRVALQTGLSLDHWTE